MISQGITTKVTSRELSEFNGPIHYQAHHAVLKLESKSTQCQIVFQCSADFHGHVLNECFEKGPDIMNTFWGALLRFKKERIGFIVDVSKLLHSIIHSF